MNIHPIFVHFPVALLTIYSLMELARFKILTDQPYWFYVKAIFVILGSLGSLAAWLTGEMAQELIKDDQSLRPIIEKHHHFAIATIIIFGTLALYYIVLWANRENISRFFSGNSFLLKLWQIKVKLAHFFVETPVVILLALAGLICVTITGGLGGIIVYGKNADPFFGAVYNLLF